jgi:hypothetical protein
MYVEAFVVLVALVAFALTGWIAWLSSGARAWSFVDIAYYPLAAIGVTLLFVNNASQRRLLELSEEAASRRAALKLVQDAEPKVGALPDDGITDTSWRLLDSVAGLGEVCGRIPSTEAHCIVTRRLTESVRRFLQVAQAGSHPRKSNEMLATCSAAAAMLTELRANNGLSVFVMDELIAAYKQALSKGYLPLSYPAVTKDAASLQQRLSHRVAEMRPLVPGDDETTRLVFEIFAQESEYAKTLLTGLYPCIVAPTKDLALLEDWRKSKQTQSEQLAEIENERIRLKDGPPRNRFVAWLNLNLWPFVLVVALSLKFGKGVAAVKKSHSPAHPQAAPSPQPGPNETESPSVTGEPQPIHRIDADPNLVESDQTEPVATSSSQPKDV